ncbi:MAG: helix-turn-helix transcriptional regulator, partial [Clostridia bacterium]|nr:helix-turn-helix transcriptional regulator [Clostridia bacterium]
MKDIKEVFAENLLQLRKSAGFTQSDLAEKLNYSDKAVSKWERAEAVPDVSVLIAIAFLFGVSVDFLVKEHTAEETEKIYSDKRANVGLIVTLITFMALMLCQIVVYLSLSGV